MHDIITNKLVHEFNNDGNNLKFFYFFHLFEKGYNDDYNSEGDDGDNDDYPLYSYLLLIKYYSSIIHEHREIHLYKYWTHLFSDSVPNEIKNEDLVK